MNFPLFHRPGTLAFLDDDPDYLEMLALLLPQHWHVKLFLRPQDCIAELQREPPFWEADAWAQQQQVDLWRAGKPLIPQVLDYWSRSTERYSLARICVVDYSMPGMDGLEVLSELRDWPGARVLLTGQADEQIAVQAFNGGLIDQFIAKQAPDLSHRLTDAIERLLATPHGRHVQTWRATLTPQQSALLRDPGVARDLLRITAPLWVEHVVLGAPFGVLGLDAMGSASWLQLETPDGLEAHAELGQLEGLPRGDLADIRQGRRLSNLELRQALGSTRPPELGDALAIGPSRNLLCSLFAIDPAHAPDPASSYSRWLARQERRTVR